MMLYMVIETFKPGMKSAVYARYRTRGRMLPDGLEYVGSWVEPLGDRCFQLMRTHDARRFDQWVARWSDLVDFEVVPVAESGAAEGGLAATADVEKLPGASPVRELHAGDLAQLTVLYRYLNPDDNAAAPARRVEQQWHRVCGSEDHFCLGVDIAGRLVASCALTVVPNVSCGGRPYSLIENVVTDPAFRRRGHGRTVVRAAIDLSRGRGCYKVMLMSGNSRGDGAHAFYESMGFDGNAKRAFVIYEP